MKPLYTQKERQFMRDYPNSLKASVYRLDLTKAGFYKAVVKQLKRLLR